MKKRVKKRVRVWRKDKKFLHELTVKFMSTEEKKERVKFYLGLLEGHLKTEKKDYDKEILSKLKEERGTSIKYEDAKKLLKKENIWDVLGALAEICEPIDIKFENCIFRVFWNREDDKRLIFAVFWNDKRKWVIRIAMSEEGLKHTFEWRGGQLQIKMHKGIIKEEYCGIDVESLAHYEEGAMPRVREIVNRKFGIKNDWGRKFNSLTNYAYNDDINKLVMIDMA